ncbi:hypothetical protein TNCV_2480761 [Trichonephila clavipes]|nr:hypothetical protein TNCV_2480761 [Trichonephila clavipes]
MPNMQTMHCMYGRAIGNGRATLRMYHKQFPVRRMPDRRIFQWLHRQLGETCSFQVTRYYAGRRRAVPIEESILNIVDDRRVKSKNCCSSRKCGSSDCLHSVNPFAGSG